MHFTLAAVQYFFHSLTHLVVSLTESIRESTDHVAAIRTGPRMMPRYVRELTYCTPLKVTCGLVALPTHQWKLQTPSSSETLVYCYHTIRHHIQEDSELYHNSRQQIMVKEQMQRKNHGCDSNVPTLCPLVLLIEKVHKWTSQHREL
jgi:hypothetical protein